MSEKSSNEILEYKGVLFKVGDIVQFKEMLDLPELKFPTKIRRFYEPDMVMLEGVGNEWMEACSMNAIEIVEKAKVPTVVATVGEEDVGMTHLAISVEKGSSICGRCGRALSAPRSVAAGFGPICYIHLFGKPQPPAPGELPKISKRSRRISKIDLSKMTDLREWFR